MKTLTTGLSILFHSFTLSLFHMNTLNAQCDLPGGWDPTTFVYDVSASFSTMPATLTAEDVEIQTPFDVDQDATWSNCQVGVTGGDAITITSGNTLTITSGTLVTTKAELWDGIVVENGAELVVNGSSIICRALTAITVNITASGDVIIDGAFFYENYRSMLFNVYTAGLHPATVVASTFDGGFPTALPSGAPTTYGSIGIEVIGVNDGATPISQGLAIGNPSSGANLFTNLDRGIVSSNSTMLIRNSDFEDIFDVNPPLNGIAILGICSPNVTTADMLIGASSSGANTFTDCQTGIQLTGFDYVKVGDNVFNQVSGDFKRGIGIFDGITTVIVESNTLTDFDQKGIYLEDNAPTTMNVRDNTLSSTVTGCTITAIELVEPTATGSVTFAIRDNIIDDVQMGIRATNTEDIEISRNIITFTQPSGCTGDLAFGIRVEGATNGWINLNTISGLCSSCTNAEIIGIAARNSPGVLFTTNEVELSGYGILVADDCLEGNAVCNTITNCNKGFGFQSVAIGEEFGPVEYVSSPGDPSDNAWFPASTANRTHAFSGTDGDDIDWYYRGLTSTPAPGTEHDASINNTTTSTIISPIAIVSTIDLCGQTMRSAGSSESQFAHASIPASILTTLQQDSAANSVSNQSYTFLQTAKLRELSNPIVSHLLAQTNIDALDAVEQFIRAKDWVGATNLLASLSAINDEEQGHMDVLAILLDGKQNQATAFNGSAPRVISYIESSQIAELEAIANLDASGRRVPVLMAQAILGHNSWSVDAFEERLSFQHTSSGEKLDIYPNPTSGVFTVQAPESIESLEVYDSFGQLVHHVSNQGTGNTQQVMLSIAEPGIYQVKARLASGSSLSSTLVLVAN